MKSSTRGVRRQPRGPDVPRTRTTPAAHPPSTRLERSLDEVEHYVNDFALDHPDKAVSLLRYCNVLGPDITTSLTQALDLPVGARHRRLRPAAPVRPRGRRRAVAALRHGPAPAGHFNVAGDGLLPWSEIVAIAGKRRWPLPAVRHGRGGPAAAPARHRHPHPRAAGPAALRPRPRQPAPQGRGLHLPLRHRGRDRQPRRRPPAAPHRRPRRRRTTATSRTSRSSSAGRPPSCASPCRSTEAARPTPPAQGPSAPAAPASPARRADRGDGPARLHRRLRRADQVGAEELGRRRRARPR